ncbi:hypothetical protein IA74_019470 [Bacteroides fragilis]|uniref:Transmembrane protein n=2 Tax=Bacteroidales TaxID=171549 RepID=A0AAP8ZY61_BACFG|nr:hypothetical protein IA74_015060 [Bacteroides fragilis]QCQ38104.1 hypothetical protein IA74_019470 [Bacteroides fragilis]WOF11945.1 hypothetical protein F1644_06535 [Butyricimonas paravirosa]
MNDCTVTWLIAWWHGGTVIWLQPIMPGCMVAFMQPSVQSCPKPLLSGVLQPFMLQINAFIVYPVRNRSLMPIYDTV